ncbi:MAG: stage II sporulation protein M, partial [Planctomycetota bacterium]
MAKANLELRSETFRAERERTWKDLESAVSSIERRGLSSLTQSTLARLPRLYRATLSSLSVARSISLDKNVLEYLESLSSRAYVCVYSNKRLALSALLDYLRQGYPRAVRALRWPLLFSAVTLLLGLAVGFILTVQDPERFYAFLSSETAAGRDPTASREFLHGTLYGETDDESGLATFSSMLFSNNARVGILCFALGFVAGLPVFFLLPIISPLYSRRKKTGRPATNPSAKHRIPTRALLENSIEE